MFLANSFGGLFLRAKRKNDSGHGLTSGSFLEEGFNLVGQARAELLKGNTLWQWCLSEFPVVQFQNSRFVLDPCAGRLLAEEVQILEPALVKLAKLFEFRRRNDSRL
jgi:hypothetical protein